jgi:hypothetical protein
MSQRSPAPDVPYPGVEHSEATGWVAWVLLGSIILVLLGAVHLCIGLVALARPEVLAQGRADLLLPVGLTGVAWFHIVVGVGALAAGVGLVRGRRWGRIGAILLAGLAALVNFTFLGVYPVLSATAIGMAIIIIYAVAAHGAEVADAYGDS